MAMLSLTATLPESPAREVFPPTLVLPTSDEHSTRCRLGNKFLHLACSISTIVHQTVHLFTMLGVWQGQLFDASCSYTRLPTSPQSMLTEDMHKGLATTTGVVLFLSRRVGGYVACNGHSCQACSCHHSVFLSGKGWGVLTATGIISVELGDI